MAMYTPYYSPYTAFSAPQMQQAINPTPMPTNAPTAQNNGILWVQGEQAAKSYLVGAGNSVLLMDSDATRFYLKSADASGMPLPLRIFEYKEVTGQVQPVGNTDQFVTRKEFDEFKAMFAKANEKQEAEDGKLFV